MSSKYYISNKRKEGYHHTYTIYDSYNEYTEDIDKSIYISVVKDFFKELSKEVIVNRLRWKMPFKIGTIRIQKKKNKSSVNARRINWEATKRLDKKMYHLNLHSNNNYFKFLWDKLSNTPGKGVYKFYPTRNNKRSLAKTIKERAKDPTLKDYNCLS